VVVDRIGFGHFAKDAGLFQASLPAAWRTHSGGLNPREVSRPLMRLAASACLAFFRRSLRVAPCGSDCAAWRASFAAVFNVSSKETVCVLIMHASLVFTLPSIGAARR
jgi:hypothetical protein